MLPVSSGPATTDTMRSVARRSQDAQTNMLPITPNSCDTESETGCKRRKGGTPDEELSICGDALDEAQTDGLNVKLEEHSRDSRVGADLPFVVCDTVLNCM